MRKANKKAELVHQRRVMRVRKKLAGTPDRPRMSMMKTNRHLYVQLIDDERGITLASATTCTGSFPSDRYSRRNKGNARIIGEQIAEKAKELGISKVVFDRGGSAFHGIFAELAGVVRERGLVC